METITIKELAALFESAAQKMAENADTLCAMDARMGDGDLGLTMKKGFGALPDFIRETEETDIGKLLMKAGMKMASLVPSTMGTLMASGIMSGGKALAGKNVLTAADFAAYLAAFAQGIEKRGKCARGDRTVLDAIGAAADSAKAVLDADPAAGLSNVAKASVSGAKDGVEATKLMKPKFGKAAVHAAAAEGNMDQGAFAGQLMIEGYSEAICGRD